MVPKKNSLLVNTEPEMRTYLPLCGFNNIDYVSHKFFFYFKIIPIESSKLKLQNTFRTPVYVTQARRNAMSVGLVFEGNLSPIFIIFIFFQKHQGSKFLIFFRFLFFFGIYFGYL